MTNSFDIRDYVDDVLGLDGRYTQSWVRQKKGYWKITLKMNDGSYERYTIED